MRPTPTNVFFLQPGCKAPNKKSGEPLQEAARLIFITGYQLLLGNRAVRLRLASGKELNQIGTSLSNLQIGTILSQIVF